LTAAGAGLDLRRLEQATLLLHFDARWGPRLLDGAVLGLSPAEKALLARTDPRAFRADSERAARAVGVVVAELPVAVAVAGLPRLFSFFADDAFVDVVAGAVPLVVGAARFLDNVPARVEGAVAVARRRRRAPCAAVAVAPHVAAAVVPDDAVDRWAAARARLGDDPAAALAAGQRLEWRGDSDDVAGVLVCGDPQAPSVGRCASPLARLLLRFADGGTLEEFRAEARALGCDDDAEADGLRDDLRADGLLA
jgi:hypothetical protein